MKLCLLVQPLSKKPYFGKSVCLTVLNCKIEGTRGGHLKHTRCLTAL